ncbi:MAG TPA: sulfate permease [Alphaproteobacteria bacterium]|nr:sulfate permease [Alphaproteobacteria bacterium]
MPDPMTAPASAPSGRSEFTPKLATVLREGYGLAALRADALAGLTVAIVALPLAMALAIASGTTPERGLFTAIVAGFLISALGGSRHQIGGPTGAFVVVVYDVIGRHGYDGLILATLLAGLMLVAAGWARLGSVIKYIPYPVVTGFTAGIAVIIFSSQIKDLLGLRMESVPADFLEKWAAYGRALGTFDPASLAVSALSLGLIVAIRRWRPRLPFFLIGVAAGALAVRAFGLEVATIGSAFGGIPSALPAPALPDWDWARIVAVLPDAGTIAFLAGIESLLSAVIADGMTGRRHRSNGELVAQGVANAASALFGGLPATGAIARTVTNIKSGARSPVAGMLHALFLLLFVWWLAPLAALFPLPSLAAVLVVVAWNMSEIERFRHLMSAPKSDRLVLLATFGLTVLADLTVAIQVGMVLAALLFMIRMAQVTEIGTGLALAAEGEEEVLAAAPPGVEIFEIRGPFFFGVASRLNDVLDHVAGRPLVFILRMRHVPAVDASGIHALEQFVAKCGARGTRVILTGVQPQPREAIERMTAAGPDTAPILLPDLPAALALARRIAAEGAPG